MYNQYLVNLFACYGRMIDTDHVLIQFYV